MRKKKLNMSFTCGFKYEEYWNKANIDNTMSSEDWKLWYSEHCGKCEYMGEICMYAEEELRRFIAIQ